MNTIADTALRGVVGLVVLAALFITIWVAKDSSARVGPVRPEASAGSTPLQSVRTDRAPVTRTAITPEQLEELERSTANP